MIALTHAIAGAGTEHLLHVYLLAVNLLTTGGIAVAVAAIVVGVLR